MVISCFNSSWLCIDLKLIQLFHWHSNKVISDNCEKTRLLLRHSRNTASPQTIKSKNILRNIQSANEACSIETGKKKACHRLSFEHRPEWRCGRSWYFFLRCEVCGTYCRLFLLVGPYQIMAGKKRAASSKAPAPKRTLLHYFSRVCYASSALLQPLTSLIVHLYPFQQCCTAECGSSSPTDITIRRPH